ncbi:MAG: pyruvate dehydrogenase (acetyl-transferring), homodimeric type [Deltaproteobacteria bacterium]|nr:pyruvate dehydrogenase (acetyl-transferring), homodimeric type [Deltaproteobacteria bacterium]
MDPQDKKGRICFPFETPYINTIPVGDQPPYPGDFKIEQQIRNMIRWNAMAMVVRANTREPGIGGHISTYASSANLLEVAFCHFLKGHDHPEGGDQVFFQGHSSPGIYARAFLEGRVTLQQMENFRRELAEGGGLSSYPHPWLMPDFWEFPTVSMGLSPIQAIYQARFNRYLEDRGIKETSGQRVWAFVGDGEMDEPESMGSITVASREQLDNLIFVVNCNLQRLDGPVRGNGKIIQELESIFRGAGWNVIKVIWGRDWDPLLAADKEGHLVRRMGEAVDGDYQKYVVEPGSYTRQHFFGRDPELLKMVELLTDDQIRRLRRGGHDTFKIYSAYKAAMENKGSPTIILAKTIKGYGLGEGGEGRNITHQQKKLNEAELRQFRDRFKIPISDKHLKEAPFYRPPANSPEIEYLLERRRALGGFVPRRKTAKEKISTVTLSDFREFLVGTQEGREVSTTMAFVSLLSKLLRHPRLGKFIVPILPDEARTFGMEPLFRQVGIYSAMGQLYEPVDAKMILYYREAKEGQLIEEGLTEAGAISSFAAAGSSESSHGVTMIPFYIFYSMFGFQRVGDLIWALQDQRCRGFILGATAGRTTLSGEGLQHQDGHSPLFASAYPRVKSYEPTFAYEILVLIREGIREMYERGRELMYYLTLQNENYPMAPMPDGVEEGILKGMYLFSSGDMGGRAQQAALPRVTLLGSGSIFQEVLKAQKILREKFHIIADVWNVTSYSELRREALEVERWNVLHPSEPQKKPWITERLGKVEGPVISVSDWIRAVPDQIARWVPHFYSLGTDGLGRSASRAELRRFFEVDAESIVVASLSQLARQGKIGHQVVGEAIQGFGVNPAKEDPGL